MAKEDKSNKGGGGSKPTKPSPFNDKRSINEGGKNRSNPISRTVPPPRRKPPKND